MSVKCGHERMNYTDHRNDVYNYCRNCRSLVCLHCKSLTDFGVTSQKDGRCHDCYVEKKRLLAIRKGVTK